MGKLTIRQVAKRYNKSHYQALYAVSKGLIKAEKLGWFWVIDEKDLPDQWPIKGRGRKRKGD